MPATIDARGKPCPQPVIMARKALAESPEVTVIVDNPTARENVTGMARSQGHAVQVEERSDGIYLHITVHGAQAPAATPEATPAFTPAGPLVVLLGCDSLGRGPEELARFMQPPEIAEVALFLATQEGNAMVDEIVVRRLDAPPWMEP